ncbi:MAG: hypothetical protein AVDCRST_MAG68-586 [uncultured Gemmatimonadetes bacterium]|uniref:Uncharacterized protein n=1 Tax=uncultured Gemmatimonadota bacterium TaxID=203437 RepID=A0A6J4KEJ8_9BACT|nr:MAG: hypothetical protein AVDCRST_MAG68-586 [uncultured Gemmatimonadota bacterium]
MQDDRSLDSTARPKKRRWLSGCLGCGGLGLLLLVGLGVLGAMGEDDAPAAVETRAFASSPGAAGGASFAPFSFDYPTDWEREEDPRDLVRVVRKEGGVVAEALRVGYFTSDADLGPMIEDSRRQLAAAFPKFQPVKTGPVTIGGRAGQQVTFSAETDAGEEIWGRLILLRGDDGRGLSLLMIATPAAKGVEGPAHVGEQGELPVVLRSFKMGQP